MSRLTNIGDQVMPYMRKLALVVAFLASNASHAFETEAGEVIVNIYTSVSTHYRPSFDKCKRSFCSVRVQGSTRDGKVLSIGMSDGVTPAPGKERPKGRMPLPFEMKVIGSKEDKLDFNDDLESVYDPPQWYKDEVPVSQWPDFNTWIPGNPSTTKVVGGAGYSSNGSRLFPYAKSSVYLNVPDPNPDALYHRPGHYGVRGGWGEAYGSIRNTMHGNIFLEPIDRTRQWGGVLKKAKFRFQFKDTGGFTVTKRQGVFESHTSQLQPVSGLSEVWYSRLFTVNTLSLVDGSFRLVWKEEIYREDESDKTPGQQRGRTIRFSNMSGSGRGPTVFEGEYKRTSISQNYEEGGKATGVIEWEDEIEYSLPEIAGNPFPTETETRGNKFKIPFRFTTYLEARMVHPGEIDADFSTTSEIVGFKVMTADDEDITDLFRVTNSAGLELFKFDPAVLVPILNMLLED